MIDTVIVGAGPSGLCAAKTILQCNPHAEVRIIEAGSTIGGVWAKEKLYPTLKTNHYFGGMDFSDYPMQHSHETQADDHIPGTAVNNFLNDYARHWGLVEKVQFNTRVHEVSRLDDGQGWQLITFSPDEQVLRCRKLIVAMGVNNRPSRPQIAGSETFQGPLLHSADIGLHSNTLLSDPKMQTVAVLGGGKSAYDAVQMLSSAGRQVEWIIRKSGKGPVWVFPMTTKMGPFEVQKDRLPVRRFVSFFSPCIWNDGFRWIRSLFHTTLIGKFITRLFWAQLQTDTINDCGYRADAKLRPLEPEHNPFWYGTTGGSCKYLPELFDRIRAGQVRVHREDIKGLGEHAVYFKNGQHVVIDAMITATGYSPAPTIKFTPPASHSDLGLPSDELTMDQAKFWANLDFQSDLEIARRFPSLVSGPEGAGSCKSITATESTTSPFRLYRSIAPPGLASRGDRSLVFLGVFSNFANHARLEIQCLWAYAYLNNQLQIDTAGVFKEASMTSRFSRHRTPNGHGKQFPDHVFDQLAYFDTLLGDLGLPSWRKKNVMREIFEPYTVTDYRGIVQEWHSKRAT